MATVLKFQYPGDPVLDVVLLTGAEFRRLHPDREIVFYGADIQRIPVTEVLCDLCSAQIADDVFCALSHSSLYCQTCYQQWIVPYLLPGSDDASRQ